MEAKTNYTVVGLGVLILSAALLACVLWLSTGFNNKNYISYGVFLHEAAAGLNIESPVKFNGVPVGYVKEIKLNPSNPQEVELLLYIEEGTPITVSTTAALVAQGITGNTYVGLAASSSDLTPLQIKNGEPWPIIPSRPSLLNQLDHAIKQVSENINAVSVRIQKVLDEENTKNFKKILKNIQKFSAVLAKKGEALTDNLSNAGKNITTTMQAGKKAINKISGEAVPPAVELMHKLNHVADNLEKVTKELKQNPAVIFRGSAPPKPGPGER